MQTCGNCDHWKNGMCKNDLAFGEFGVKHAETKKSCCMWEGKSKDKDYDVEKINDALKPLGVTFDELICMRYAELMSIDYILTTGREERRKEGTFGERYEEIVDKIKFLENIEIELKGIKRM